MSLRVKRYTLKYGGKLYRTGETVEMPDAEARRLAQVNPGNVEMIKQKAAEAEPAKTATVKKTAAKTEAALPAVDAAKLVKKA